MTPRGGTAGHGADHRFALVLLAAALAVWGVGMAALMARSAPADAAQGPVLAVFAPGTSPAAMEAAVFAAGGGPVRRTALPFALVAAGPHPGFAGRLRRTGAAWVLGDFPLGPTLAGCAATGTVTDRVPAG